jgi:hypothetical protein
VDPFRERASGHNKHIDDVKQDVRMLNKHLLERKPAGPDA